MENQLSQIIIEKEVSINQACKLTGLNYRFIKSEIDSGRLRSAKINSKYLILPSDIRNWQIDRRNTR